MDERLAFEDMMNDCRRRASAAGAACFPSIADAMFLTILFKHHQTIKELEKIIEEIEREVKQPSRRNQRMEIRPGL